MTCNNCANCACKEDVQTIHITHDELNVYRDIDYNYGVVFEEAFAFITHPHLCLDLWGFGDDVGEAIGNLFKTTEEYNAVLKGEKVRFVLEACADDGGLRRKSGPLIASGPRRGGHVT